MALSASAPPTLAMKLVLELALASLRSSTLPGFRSPSVQSKAKGGGGVVLKVGRGRCGDAAMGTRSA